MSPVIGTTVQHYRIGERLGAGGMGEVYRAEDLRLGRPVALKFLPHALKSDPESRARLLNEARAASLLRSPNIAVTYDIGEDGGADFIVMEYVDGELLSSRVARGSLPVREVVDTGLQVADALDEAHARGIVHRDIKSANLMRTERGLVKVLDFGLAKFLPGGPPAVTQSPMTMAGMVVGTVSYMSPEQALGRTVDHRADLFSLGVVLFELLTGRTPFEGTSPTEIIDRILHEAPPPVSRFTSGVPAALDTVVARALEKDPLFRYQSAREFYTDLRYVAAELDQAPCLASSRAIAATVAGPVDNSVAVMTFANITREPADDWIGTGIAETVSSDLKNIHGLTIIGRRLGATWVVVGGFQRSGGMVRITANFVDVATGAVRRTVKVDGTIDDIFALQDKIVYELSQGLNVVLRGTEIAGLERQFDRAEEVCRRAIDLQEQFISGNMGLQIVGAHSRLGYVHYLRGQYAEAHAEYERELVFIGSRDHALRDRTLIELNVKIGAAHLRQGRRDEAERHFTRALKSFDARVADGADDPFTRYYIADLHALRGDASRALDSLERAARELPALTAARARRDVDLESLHGEERFRFLDHLPGQ